MRCLIPLLVLPAVLTAQEVSVAPWRLGARLEAGTLNPQDPFAVTMALGGSFGIVSERNGFFVRYTRQSRDRNQGPDFNDLARHFWTVEWEHAFTPAQPFEQQFLLRVGAGVLNRGARALKDAPVMSVGATFRYPVGRMFSFVGTLEDQIADLPYQRFDLCYMTSDPYTGQPVQACDTYEYGGELQHNFGLFIAFEVRP